jgi:hypothetical protein
MYGTVREYKVNGKRIVSFLKELGISSSQINEEFLLRVRIDLPRAEFMNK